MSQHIQQQSVPFPSQSAKAEEFDFSKNFWNWFPAFLGVAFPTTVYFVNQNYHEDYFARILLGYVLFFLLVLGSTLMHRTRAK